MRRLSLRATIGTGAVLVTLIATPGFGLGSTTPAHARAKISHGQAAALFRDAGITWSAGGRCSTRRHPRCPSFERLNLTSARGAITLRRASACALDIVGGTDRSMSGTEHGTYSHAGGYRLSYRPSRCLDRYIARRFTPLGGDAWQSGSGNVYHRRSDHWDATYYNCGGC